MRAAEGLCAHFNKFPCKQRAAKAHRNPAVAKEGLTYMFDIHREEIDWGGRKLTLETGRIARQADGAVFASIGETTVMAAARNRFSAADLRLPRKDVCRGPYSRRLF
jgi:hypothetical protein